MTNLDHGKFTRVTTVFHGLLALVVFLLFFTGYGIMFNDALWWLVVLAGGTQGVVAVHRAAGLALIVLTVFWMVLMVISPTGRGNFREVLPTVADVEAAIQDVKFALGWVDERHPHARQFAGYSADEIPLLSYVGKGVVWIFSVELTLLMISGLLIWNKPALISIFQSAPSAMAFVVFHGLLGIIMFMGVMFHIFEHGFHPAFYPVELKAFVPKNLSPGYHGDGDEAPESTGIEGLTLRPSWRWATNLMGLLVVVGISSILLASIFKEGYPIPRELAVGRGPSNLLLVFGVNVAVLVLFIGLVLSVYGQILKQRWIRHVRETERRDSVAAESDRGGDD